MSEILIPSLSQLAMQTPLYLVYLAGLVFSLVFWRRCPIPCLLALLACILLLIVGVTQTFVTQYLFFARHDLDWEFQRFGWMLSAIGIVGSFLRALGLGLLLAAVFLGRSAAPWGALPEEPAARN
jgi:hypothetical protein